MTASMRKYRTRPSFVEAMQWSGGNESIGVTPSGIMRHNDGRSFVLTPEGERELAIGDWLVRDSTGAYLPMADDTFRSHYEPAQALDPAI